MFQKNQDVSKLREPYLKLLDEIKEKIDFQKQDSVTNDKRIFIYTVQYLEATTHSPSNIVRIWAEQFEKIGYRVIIVSCTPLPFPYKLKVGHSSFNQNSIVLGDLAELYENTFIIELSGNPLRDNIYQDFCNQLQLSENDTFITIDERCIPFDILPFKRKFLIPSSANINVTTANVLLANIDLNVTNLENKKLEFIFATNDYTLSDDIVFTIKPITSNEKIKLVMVGNRLQNEIDETLWNGLISLYEKNKNIEVVIVGTFDENLIPNELKPCVSCAGYQHDLKTFLRDIHFYINPTRNGGGQSALLAVKLGMPVLTIDFGDVASVINHLYCLESFLEIEHFVNNYINNSEFKKEIDSYNERLYYQSKKDSNSLLTTCRKVVEYRNE
jgi:glycosyltransferase involved in cell wall biosynthesis